MAEFKYEIQENLGEISESGKGWTRELNLISWNGGKPKYDIRDWNKNCTRMSKGITLNESQMQELVEFYLADIK